MVMSPLKGRALSAATIISVISVISITASNARAAEATPEQPPSPAAAGQTAVAQAAPLPPETEELKFSAPASQPDLAPPAASSPGRAKTMEEVAASAELSIRAVHWRYSLNFFGDVALSLGSPNADHMFGFAIGDQDILMRGELGNN